MNNKIILILLALMVLMVAPTNLQNTPGGGTGGS